MVGIWCSTEEARWGWYSTEEARWRCGVIHKRQCGWGVVPYIGNVWWHVAHYNGGNVGLWCSTEEARWGCGTVQRRQGGGVVQYRGGMVGVVVSYIGGNMGVWCHCAIHRQHVGGVAQYRGGKGGGVVPYIGGNVWEGGAVHGANWEMVSESESESVLLISRNSMTYMISLEYKL